MMRRTGLLLASLVALASCSGMGERGSVTGELAYVERIALPPGARAQVVLRAEPVVDATTKGFAGPGETVARDTIEIAHAVPIPFRLDYRSDTVPPPSALVIDAWIFAADQVLFAVTGAALDSESGTPVRLILHRPRHIAYVCDDGSRPAIAFLRMSAVAFLHSDSDAPVALHAQPVGSGFYYTGGGYGLRGKGREAVLQRPSGNGTPCLVPRIDRR